MRLITAFLIAIALLAGTHTGHAQSGPIRILVGVPPGASTDLVARLVADKMQGLLNETLIVDNKPGAGQRIAVAELKKAAPDGRTIMLAGNGVFSLLPHIYGDRLGYDPVKDFTPITRGVVFHVGLAAGPATRTMADFLKWAKAQPSGITFGSPGAGSTSHFAGLMFAKAAKLNMTHAAYRGGAPALNDLMGGHVAMVSTAGSDLPPLAKAGKLSIIATAGPTRMPATPDVPTLRELGYDIAFESAFDFYAPAGVPKEMVQRLHGALVKAMAMPDVRARIEEIGLQVGGGTPEELAAKQAAEFAWWAAPVKESGFKGE